MAQASLGSYLNACREKCKMHQKAPILAPLAKQFTLREFNLYYAEALGPYGPLTRYSRSYALWHLDLFGAGRPALTVKVHRWGIKEQKALRWYDEAAAYLVSRLQHVAHGTHRIKTEKGWMEFSAALRTEDKEALWRGFTSEHGADGVCRTAFHEMAATIASGQLKDLSALDVVAEFCGRTQFERLRSYLAEAVRDFAPSTKAHADFSRPARPVS